MDVPKKSKRIIIWNGGSIISLRGQVFPLHISVMIKQSYGNSPAAFGSTGLPLLLLTNNLCSGLFSSPHVHCSSTVTVHMTITVPLSSLGSLPPSEHLTDWYSGLGVSAAK
jgi:hypothetical protein